MTALVLALVTESSQGCPNPVESFFAGPEVSVVGVCSDREGVLTYRITLTHHDVPGSDGRLDQVMLAFRGSIVTTVAPEGWLLQRATSPTGATELTWHAVKKKAGVARGRSLGGFVVSVSGQGAGVSCERSYAVHGSSVSGGLGSCIS